MVISLRSIIGFDFFLRDFLPGLRRNSPPNEGIPGFADDVEESAQNAANREETGSLVEIEFPENGINPESSQVRDDGDPCHVSDHGCAGDGHAVASSRVDVERGDTHEEQERNHRRVEQMVMERADPFVETRRHNELPVDGPDSPEENDDGHADGEGQGGVHVIPDSLDSTRVLITAAEAFPCQCGQYCQYVVGQLSPEIEEGQIFGRSAEGTSRGSHIRRDIDDDQLKVDDIGV